MLWMIIAIIGWLIAICLFGLLSLVSLSYSLLCEENKQLKKLHEQKVAKWSSTSRVWKTKEV